MLFMREGPDTPTHYMPSDFEFESEVRGAVQSKYQLSEPDAKRLYNHLAVYVHGLAVLFAQGACIFSDEDVSRMLSEVFVALKKE